MPPGNVYLSTVQRTSDSLNEGLPIKMTREKFPPPPPPPPVTKLNLLHTVVVIHFTHQGGGGGGGDAVKMLKNTLL